jgi:hypothetical protein
MTFSEYSLPQEDQGPLLRRRYAETRLAPALQAAMSEYGETLAVVALVAGEDPDTIAVLPVIARLLAVSQRIQLRILTDDDTEPLAVLLPDLDVAAALEEWDLPQFLIFDEEWELQTQWGPRPAQAERNLAEWLRRYPEYERLADEESTEGQQRYVELTNLLTHEMRIWYNSSLAAACQQEFCDVLATLLPAEESNEGEGG